MRLAPGRRFIYVDVKNLRLNRSAGKPKHPSVIVSDGAGGRERYRAVRIKGESFIYEDQLAPCDGDAKVFIVTDAELDVSI